MSTGAVANFRACRPGDRLGEWVLEAPAGRGDGGEVWRARHHALPRAAAVTIASDPAAAERLRAAGQHGHRLTDPRIVRVLGCDLGHEPPYLAQEWVEGESLRMRLARDGPVPWREAVAILDDVCGALDAAHALGIVHGGLRPERCFGVAGSPGVRVTGFGLADLGAVSGGGARVSDVLDEDGARRLRQRAYVAPELAGGAPATAAGDCFAAGVIGFELLVGDVPHGSESPRDGRAEVPAALETVLATARARLERRFPSAHAMQVALRAAAGPAVRGMAPRIVPPAPVAAPPAPGIQFGDGTVRCAGCGQANRLADRGCVRCGRPLHAAAAAVARCGRCGAPLARGRATCDRCGTPRTGA